MVCATHESHESVPSTRRCQLEQPGREPWKIVAVKCHQAHGPGSDSSPVVVSSERYIEISRVSAVDHDVLAAVIPQFQRPVAFDDHYLLRILPGYHDRQARSRALQLFVSECSNISASDGSA